MMPCGRREEVSKEIGEDKRHVNEMENEKEVIDSKTSAIESVGYMEAGNTYT